MGSDRVARGDGMARFRASTGDMPECRDDITYERVAANAGMVERGGHMEDYAIGTGTGTFTDAWRETRVVGGRGAVDLDDHVILAYRQALAIAWDDREWRERANCRTIDPDLFFPQRGDGPEKMQAAKEVCRGCEVADDCLVYALKASEKFGVWGGLSDIERRYVAREVRAMGVKREAITVDVVVRAKGTVAAKGGVREMRRTVESRAS